MWVSLILGLLSYILSKSAGASDTKALTAATLVGAGAYYTTTQTDWGKANLGALDAAISGESTPVISSDGQPVSGSGGGVLNTLVGGTADVLKSWGGVGTAAVVGTAAAASGGLLSNPWVLGGLAVAAFLLLSK